MAAADYKGWLLEIEGTKLPMEYIAHSSYGASPDQKQDEDSYQDGYGALHRNVLPHTRTKIEWNRPDMVHLTDLDELLSFFPDKDKMKVRYWNDKKLGYYTGEFYYPTIQFNYYDASDKDIRYNSIRLALIEY